LLKKIIVKRLRAGILIGGDDKKCRCRAFAHIGGISQQMMSGLVELRAERVGSSARPDMSRTMQLDATTGESHSFA
jgi:hypothetical protein